MTRINLVHPNILSRQHLIAEYREITRLPGNLTKSLNRKSKPFDMNEIPPEYVLGPGHVKFFYDKMKFLHDRFTEIVATMQKRGYTTNFTTGDIFKAVPLEFYNDYKPTEKAIELNKQRIKERS